MRRMYKYAILGLVLFALGAHAKQSTTIPEKFSESLGQLSGMFEAARDRGLDGYESFVDSLKEHQTKLDEYYHPEHKSWGTAAKDGIEDGYDAAVEKLKDWQCQAEEKIHELRYGKSAFSCSAKSLPERAKDKVAYVLGSTRDALSSSKEDVKEKVKETVGYDDLEKHFESARDEGKQQLHDLIASIKSQRQKLESTYDDILDKASKTGDLSSDKAKEWRDHFTQSAGDSLRSFREMSDDFEQRIQDFLGTDKSRWGFFSKLKFW